MIHLVVMDFDDTLSLTEEAGFYLENETATQLGFSPMQRETHIKNWGNPLEDAIAQRIPGIDPKQFMNQFAKNHHRFIRENRIDVITKPTIDFLDSLRESGKRLAIVTSRTLPEAKHLLGKQHLLHKRIEKFYHKDNSRYLKPDPRVFRPVLKDFSVKPNETVYLGDSLGDAVSAKMAGLHFIAVLESGLRTRAEFAPFGVDFFVEKLPEASDYIAMN